MISSRLCIIAGLVAASTLSACGQAEEKKVAGPAAERGIFISTRDCAESGKITADNCSKAIDEAVAVYNGSTIKVYKSLRQCEAGEGGPDRCDKTGEGEYRPRLQAFFITMSEPPKGVPLLPPKGPSIAFTSPSKQVIDARDESLHVSTEALTVANENAKLSAASSDTGGVAGVAAAVH